MSRANAYVRVGPGGRGVVVIDGHRLRHVRGVKMTHSSTGLPSLTVDVNIDSADVDLHDAAATLPPETASTLVALGWTPPGGSTVSRSEEATDTTGLAALPAGEEHRQRALHVLVDGDGWGGLMHVADSLEADVDGQTLPLVRWDIPLYRAEALVSALQTLDAAGDLFAAGAEHPGPWTNERAALAEALEHLVRAGRAARTEQGFLTTTADADTSVDDPEAPTS